MNPDNPFSTESLPVNQVLSPLIDTLREKKLALLEAPPGAGKSTLVPPEIYKAGLAGDKKIYLLEPRRLAARSLSHHISRLLGEPVGGLCGYRVHRESKVSERTKIEVITEGILVRMLQSDPALEEGGVVIFDEFHERNLLSDLSLTLLMEVREELRDDLILLFMSATPDCETLSELMGDIPIVRSQGRQYPVKVQYRGKREISVVEEALRETGGDILVFLPGEREIRKWEGELNRHLTGIDVLPLFGRMPLDKQNRIISTHANSRRRVVLATSIAETSLTIPGVTAVVDTGLVRRPLFNSSSGLSLLETQDISLASAEQRAGRAGRVCPGTCYRLWEQADERGRDKQSEPEILQADLAPLVLELARWGCSDPDERKWLTPPPPGAWFGAVELLQLLGALDRKGRVTERGKKMAQLPVHPRLANLLIYGTEQGLRSEAALLAAFLGQRDFLPASRGSDIMLRLEYLTGSRSPGEYSRSISLIREEAEHLQWLLPGTGVKGTKKDHSFHGLITEGASLLAQAYPDRIALKIDERIYQMSGGGRIQLAPSDPLLVCYMLACAHCGGNRDRQRLYLGIPIERKEVERHFPDLIVEEEQGSWNRDKKRVSLVIKRRLGQITLSSTPQKRPVTRIIGTILRDSLLKEGLDCLPWDKESRRLYDRMVFTSKQVEWPPLSSEGLASLVESWWVPFFREGRFEGNLGQALLSLLDWNQQKQLDRIAPDHYTSALGNRRKIEYTESQPFLPIPLQEMYGTEESPRLGKEPLVLHLLNPAGRPVQVTADLKSFWNNLWSQVRSELKGRYPRHYWPEDPIGAFPSLKTGKNRPK